MPCDTPAVVASFVSIGVSVKEFITLCQVALSSSNPNVLLIPVAT